MKLFKLFIVFIILSGCSTAPTIQEGETYVLLKEGQITSKKSIMLKYAKALDEEDAVTIAEIEEKGVLEEVPFPTFFDVYECSNGVCQVSVNVEESTYINYDQQAGRETWYVLEDGFIIPED